MSRRRRILLVTPVALALLVAFAPWLARTGVARRFVAGRISEALGRPVEIAGLDAGWTSGVALEGLVVRNGAPEFGGPPMLEARSVRLESSLPSLVLSGAEDVTVDGLTLRLEEQAGGRTNVDDFVQGLTKPAPPVKREAKPFRLRLTGASIHIRRLVRRPQPRPIDPFREDPVILDADEGLLVLGIDGMDLRLATAPKGTTLDLSAKVNVAGSEGSARIALKLDAKGPSGTVDLKGIDLSLLRPFAEGIEGRVDLHAEGSADDAKLQVRAEGLKVDRYREAWAELAGRVRKEGDGVAFDQLTLRTASDAFALDGSGAWPPKDLRVKARASAEALGLRVKGPIVLDGSGEGTAFKGTLTTPDLDMRFDLDLREDGLLIRALDAKALKSTVSLKGDVAPSSVRLEGSADVDLGDLEQLLPEGASLAGHLRVPGFSLEDSALKADAEVERLVARGLFADDLDLEHGELHVDVALSKDRDVLRIARAQLDDLKAQGVVSGLSTKDFRADGTVKGTLALNPLHARLLGLKEVRGLRGQLTVDVTASTGEAGIVASGTAAIDGLRVEGEPGACEAKRVVVNGTYRDRGAKGTATIEKIRAEGDAGTCTVARVSFDGGYRDEAIEGNATLDGVRAGSWDLPEITAKGTHRTGETKLSASTEGMRATGTLASGPTTVTVDVDAIERQPLLLRLLPENLLVRGPATLHADVESAPWSIRGTLESPDLTVKHGERGIEREELKVAFTAREEERGWAVTAPDITIGKLGVKASLAEGRIGGEGTLSGQVRLSGPLDRLTPLAPEAARFEPRGTLALDVRVAHDGRWTLAGTADLGDASLVLDRKRTPEKTARVEFDALPSDDGSWTLRRLRLTTKTSDLLGAGRVGRAITLRLEGKARLEDVSPYVPALRGSGEVRFGDIAFDLSAKGEVALSLSFEADAIRVVEGKLSTVVFRSRAQGRLADGKLEGVQGEIQATAAKCERGNILVENLALTERGGGKTGDYSLGTRIEAGRIVVGDTTWERVTLDVTGRLDRLLAERPPDGVQGQVTFARWNLGPFLWENAKGQVAVEKGDLVVRNLVAGLQGGTVRAEGKLVPVDDRLAWEGTAHAEGVVLNEQIGRPLSFVIPFLRVEKKAGTLSGVADFDLKLAADDTTDAAILRTLAGAGGAHLHDIEAKNSILLPLLTLRLDRAFLKEPYRFEDLRVAFEVAKGKVRVQPFELKAKPFEIAVKECEVGLDGKVDALILPGVIPLRVEGNLDHPKVRPAPLAPFR